MKRNLPTIAVLALLIVVYVSSYFVLSRRAYAVADAMDFVGFYFLTPKDTTVWRFTNYGLVCVYYPLIWLDNALGTGRPIAAEPLWKLSDANSLGPSTSRGGLVTVGDRRVEGSRRFQFGTINGDSMPSPSIWCGDQ